MALIGRKLDPPASSLTVLKPWHWFIFAAAVPLAHCASRLNLDLWHDEIYTVDYFVSRGPLFIVSDYSLPNNHVLYSLLLWPFYLISDVNFVLRLPSFLFTVGTLALVFAIALRQSGLVCAVLSTSLLGLNQMFLTHTIQVRGYGVSMFLTAWLTFLALADSSRTRRRWIAVVFAGAAILYVMPTNALFFVPLALASGLVRVTRRVEAREVAADVSAWFTAALVALACYSPIAEQVRAVAKSSAPSSWSSLPHIVANFFRPALHDYFWFAPVMLVSLAAIALTTDKNKPRRWTLPAVALGVVFGAFLLTAALRISPFERNYCPLLVLLALLGGSLLAELIGSVHVRSSLRTPSVAAGLSLALVALVLCPQLWTYPRRLKERREQVEPANQWITDGYYCYYAADYRPSAVVAYLAEQDFERLPFCVAYAKADFLNVWWYFYHSRLSGVSPPRDVADIYAIAPEPPPWKALAEYNGFSEQDMKSFLLIADFGFYRLYRAQSALGEGSPPDRSDSGDRE